MLSLCELGEGKDRLLYSIVENPWRKTQLTKYQYYKASEVKTM